MTKLNTNPHPTHREKNRSKKFGGRAPTVSPPLNIQWRIQGAWGAVPPPRNAQGVVNSSFFSDFSKKILYDGEISKYLVSTH